MPSYPTVAANGDRLRIFDVVPSTLHFNLMCRRKNAYSGPKHYSVSNRHQRTIENGEIEVCITAVAHGSIASILYQERWLDDHILSNTTENFLLQFRSRSVQCVKVCLGTGISVGKPSVVMVIPFTSSKPSSFELWDEGVIPVGISATAFRGRFSLVEDLQHSTYHSLILVMPGDVFVRSCQRNLLFIFLGRCHCCRVSNQVSKRGADTSK